MLQLTEGLVESQLDSTADSFGQENDEDDELDCVTSCTGENFNNRAGEPDPDQVFSQPGLENHSEDGGYQEDECEDCERYSHGLVVTASPLGTGSDWVASHGEAHDGDDEGGQGDTELDQLVEQALPAQ